MIGDDVSLKIAMLVGQRIGSDIARFGIARKSAPASPAEVLLADYDRRIVNPELRAATRSRFASRHYADAVEAGVKALNERIRARTGRTEDGDALMTVVFSPGKPLLRINKLKSKADESAQRGHMQLCQGVVAAWRNPRAHALTDDNPGRCLMMLETIGDLIETTNQAVRTRHRKLAHRDPGVRAVTGGLARLVGHTRARSLTLVDKHCAQLRFANKVLRTERPAVPPQGTVGGSAERMPVGRPVVKEVQVS